MSFPRKPLPQTPDRKTRTRIAAHAGVDERTVGRYLAGQVKTYELTERAIREAMQALGIEAPEVRR